MPRHPTHYFFGLDLGQRQDPAAITILQRVWEPTGEFNHVIWEHEYALRCNLLHAERLKLGTAYVDIVARVCRLIASVAARSPANRTASQIFAANPLTTLVVDASGVGRPVVELFRRSRSGFRLVPVTITSGAVSHTDSAGEDFVPRRDLITSLRILFEKGLLRIPTRIHERAALLKEFTHLRDRPSAHHDDLVMATALACWTATRRLNLTRPS
jgi:hypothetical protein